MEAAKTELRSMIQQAMAMVDSCQFIDCISTARDNVKKVIAALSVKKSSRKES